MIKCARMAKYKVPQDSALTALNIITLNIKTLIVKELFTTLSITTCRV